ncbi:MAG: SulP family inorganic anion transporter [Planctomycetota bacterium]|nr:SulP family inorganic anion transporter [Planctomycetota bacterium]
MATPTSSAELTASDSATRASSNLWADLRCDLLAGMTTGVLAVPQGIAFALIANVPPEYGLYAMIVPTIVAALIRSSPFLITGATNTSALVIGAMVATLAAADGQAPSPERIVTLMLTITLMMGLIQVFAGVFKLGSFGRFVSQAVLVGFTLGAATLIFCDQIRNVAGLHVPSSPRLIETLGHLARNAGAADPRALGLAAISLAVVVVCAKISRLIPGAMIAVALSGAAVWLFGWDRGEHAVSVVGEVPRALPGLTLPDYSYATLETILAPSFAIALLGMVEAISIGKALSAKARVKFFANQELFAKGVGNVVGAFLGCMPSSASWTRSAINLQMGSKTRWVGVFAGLTVLAIMLVLAPWAHYVPKACLGALVMWIAWNMVDLQAARYVWRWSRTDAAVLVITFVSTLVFEIEYAIYLGVLVSLLMLVRRAGVLHMVEMARSPAGTFRETEIDAETGRAPVVLLQLEGDLFFGIVEDLEAKLEAIAAKGAKAIIVRLRRAHAIDATASETLAAFAKHYQESGGRMILCGLRADLRERVARSHLGEVLGEANLLAQTSEPFRSVQDALDAARQTVLAKHPALAGGTLMRVVPNMAEQALTYEI